MKLQGQYCDRKTDSLSGLKSARNIEFLLDPFSERNKIDGNGALGFRPNECWESGPRARGLGFEVTRRDKSPGDESRSGL
ncbi:hypothetical protein GKA01_04080 [Gluconobacter kanchanaburiensis NBRC 103587]|uniref:Uncharacterized protein n=1 Tax=Gluconobacter kanchanaburiensis NBRC 103587 TaxID=1307948 RepID=A0A511B6E7_9PROT|nr:hypothetical protein GKA01_04080 [Gluconobacter kanchanaburiensis NBRC 103587]